MGRPSSGHVFAKVRNQRYTFLNIAFGTIERYVAVHGTVDEAAKLTDGGTAIKFIDGLFVIGTDSDAIYIVLLQAVGAQYDKPYYI